MERINKQAQSQTYQDKPVIQEHQQSDGGPPVLNEKEEVKEYLKVESQNDSGDESSSHQNQIDTHFKPSDPMIINNYTYIKEIYNVNLSPTLISLTTHNCSHIRVIKKSIRKEKLINETQLGYARNECIIHSQLKHENIVELYDYTETDKEIVLFMEFCNDANYFEEKIEASLTPIMNQYKLQSYANDILQGVDYLHSIGVIHSDLKLQNALVNRPDMDDSECGELPIVKLCDFGLSHIMSTEYRGKALMVEKCGTSGYIAPEIGTKNTLVGPEIDLWSFGVMLYEMCTAYKPTKLLNYRYGSGPIPYRDRDWRKHNKHIKDLITKCLEMDPKKRITSLEALQHPWFQDDLGD